MAETASETIQPCLLDRLTDENPDQKQESQKARTITPLRYREGVLRDLCWLLNASAHLEEEDLNQFGEVRRSVLNYGAADFCGKLASSLDLSAIEHEMLETIKTFEPRIIASTLTVKAVGQTEKFGPNIVAFEIRGDLWANPIPEQLYVKTQLDLDTGQCVL